MFTGERDRKPVAPEESVAKQVGKKRARDDDMDASMGGGEQVEPARKKKKLERDPTAKALLMMAETPKALSKQMAHMRNRELHRKKKGRGGGKKKGPLNRGKVHKRLVKSFKRMKK
eukprot:NODE_17894_length_359_cov_7.389831_g17577_i0.p2 GENE.NODE_17894_length_359_cov_7.389831_g17577_i0~~NODE_17894_length_359_cov_7.389831_g17577_i0.p2  ORF type:complete len:116 (-),score=27.50 NODE_17894_length_359_cov_7.389831_g17577_i0:11-358(-)